MITEVRRRTERPASIAASGDDDHRLGRASSVVLVFVAVIAGWEILSLLMKASTFVMPSPFTVAAQMWKDRALYPHNVQTTFVEALEGFGWGVGFAVILGIAFVQISFLERALMSAAIATYCVPIVAIGPILEVVSSGSTPKVVLAALGGFFPTLIAILLGLRAADRTSLAMVSAYGGGSWALLTKVRMRSALPSFFAGMRIAGPAAVVGAIIGEYLGGNSGLGVAMISSTQTLAVARTWGLAVVTSVVALGFYLVITLLAAWLSIVPTAPNLAAGSGAPPRAGGRLWLAVSVGRRVLGAAVAIGVILVGWVLFLRLFHLNSYFAKTPADVYRYLFSGPTAGANRSGLVHGLGRTVHDSIPGLFLGTVAGVGLAIVFVRSRTLDRALMPMAVALQSAPIVAMTPLITLTFGRDLVGITVIVALVTFFPTLLNVMRGLRSAPVESLDVINAFGGSPLTTLTKVQAQCALPTLFASLKIAVPGAMFGTMLAEFISTGNGLGFQILTASTNARFAEMWAGVVLITAVTVGLYGIVGLLESLTLHRYAPDIVPR